MPGLTQLLLKQCTNWPYYVNCVKHIETKELKSSTWFRNIHLSTLTIHESYHYDWVDISGEFRLYKSFWCWLYENKVLALFVLCRKNVYASRNYLRLSKGKLSIIWKLTLLVGVGAGTLGPDWCPLRSALCRAGVITPRIMDLGVLRELGVP